jgi:hypothetical protein
MVVGGFLLLTHTHAIGNVKEALLVELSHLPLGVLAVVAGCARWVELRGQGAPESRWGRLGVAGLHGADQLPPDLLS